MGQRVVLVDCDLRQPQQHELFGLRNDSGVTTLVAGKAKLEQPARPWAMRRACRCSPAGRCRSARPRCWPRAAWRRSSAELAGQADLVLFDAPPVVAVSDASVLATKVDGVLLVLNAGQTKRDYARRAKEALEKVNAHIVGVVLNNVADGRRWRCKATDR